MHHSGGNRNPSEIERDAGGIIVPLYIYPTPDGHPREQQCARARIYSEERTRPRLGERQRERVYQRDNQRKGGEMEIKREKEGRV